MRAAASLLSGLLFGAGLVVSGMHDPAKIIGFLDVFGAWDPSLLAVMAAALATTALGYRLAFRARAPLFDEKFHLPETTRIDRQLVLGAALFGAGWGLSGFCPGPAIVAAGLGGVEPYAFLAAMIAGMLLRRAVGARKPA